LHCVLYFHTVWRRKVEVFVYSNCLRADGKTAMFKGFLANWRETQHMSARAMADLIHFHDKIHILVDCTGHTSYNRLDVFALKPAPVQVSWIGYPNTTGLPQIQHRLTDRWADPIGTRQLHSEALRRVDRCFLCYTPLLESVERLLAEPPDPNPDDAWESISKNSCVNVFSFVKASGTETESESRNGFSTSSTRTPRRKQKLACKLRAPILVTPENDVERFGRFFGNLSGPGLAPGAAVDA
ncbi:unnamed protein product, partial [Amoebophrya sp. A25]